MISDHIGRNKNTMLIFQLSIIRFRAWFTYDRAGKGQG